MICNWCDFHAVQTWNGKTGWRCPLLCDLKFPLSSLSVFLTLTFNNAARGYVLPLFKVSLIPSIPCDIFPNESSRAPTHPYSTWTSLSLPAILSMTCSITLPRPKNKPLSLSPLLSSSPDMEPSGITCKYGCFVASKLYLSDVNGNKDHLIAVVSLVCRLRLQHSQPTTNFSKFILSLFPFIVTVVHGANSRSLPRSSKSILLYYPILVQGSTQGA